MKKKDKLLNVGDIQIRSFDHHPWEPFVLGIALAIAVVKRKYPQAQAWTGNNWIRIPIRNHIMAVMSIIDEDLEEEKEQLDLIEYIDKLEEL